VRKFRESINFSLTNQLAFETCNLLELDTNGVFIKRLKDYFDSGNLGLD